MRYFIFLFIVLIGLPGTALSDPPVGRPFKNGDLIFIVNPWGQGKAIQLATHSKYTHVGIVFIEEGKAMVYHAVEPVMKGTVEEFIAMSADNTCEIRRLKDQSLLTDKTVADLLKAAKNDLGKHYDLAFNWDDEKLYCSEYVWKLYKRCLNLEIGSLKPLRSFDLSHPVVQAKLKERYGNQIPADEKMISPGDMYNSTLVE
jgi:hypothetical protein